MSGTKRVSSGRKWLIFSKQITVVILWFVALTEFVKTASVAVLYSKMGLTILKK